MRFIDARTGEIRWNWDSVEDAHISHLYDGGEVDLRRLSERKAAEVVEYMAAHESINKAANACITLTDEEIELLTNYAELNGDEASYLRVLCFMLKEGLYDNCVLWLPFTRNLRAGINDTDTEVYDRSPFGNHGTIHGAVWQTLPSGKSALSFDGVDDYVDCGNDESLNITDAITIEAWVKSSGSADPQPIVDKMKSGSNENWVLRLKSDNKAYFFLHEGHKREIASKTVLDIGKWYHIVGTYDGSIMKIFINGIMENSTTDVGSSILTNANVPVSIGRATEYNEFFNGLIDEVRIYNRALSEEEIKRLYELTRVFYGV